MVVPDGREALVVQQLILDLRQAGLELFLLAHISVGSNKDDWRQRSDGLTQEREKTYTSLTKLVKVLET